MNGSEKRYTKSVSKKQVPSSAGHLGKNCKPLPKNISVTPMLLHTTINESSSLLETS